MPARSRLRYMIAPYTTDVPPTFLNCGRSQPLKFGSLKNDQRETARSPLKCLPSAVTNCWNSCGSGSHVYTWPLRAFDVEHCEAQSGMLDVGVKMTSRSSARASFTSESSESKVP